MMRSRYLGAVAIAAALSAGPFVGAMAGPVDFTWSPSALGAAYSADGNIVNANNLVVSNFDAISFTGTNFSGNGYLNVTSFLNGGSGVTTTGLGSNYSLFLAFTETGTQVGGIPTTLGTTTSGVFNSVTYSLMATPNGSPPVSFSASGGSTTLSGASAAITLATGSLVPGTGFVSMQDTSAGLVPTANLDLTFTENPTYSGFFAAPVTGLDVMVGNFSTTGTEVTQTGSYVDVNGGGGNLTFQTTAAPEPASLAVLGAGLLGLARVVRRRRKV